MTNKEKFKEVFGGKSYYMAMTQFGWWDKPYIEPEKEDLTTIQGRIISKMHEYGYNQKELAVMLRITEVTMSRYLNGSRSIKLDTLFKLCDLFDVSADWLLGREEHEGN